MLGYPYYLWTVGKSSHNHSILIFSNLISELQSYLKSFVPEVNVDRGVHTAKL